MGCAQREEERGRDEVPAGRGRGGTCKGWGAHIEKERRKAMGCALREEEKGRDGEGMVRMQRGEEKGGDGMFIERKRGHWMLH
eukprot:2077198-Rhodomonas_salina.2